MRGRSGRGRTNLISAAVVAVGLLIGSGAGFRVLANRLSRPNASSPIPPGTLATFPLKVGDWKGTDIELSDRIVEATDTDDHLNRGYVRQKGRGSVGLYIAYGVQARDLMPHRPQVCYPSQGWVLDESGIESITLPDGTSLSCQMLRFLRGGLSNASMTVLYYYLIDGKFFADVSELRNRSLWGSSQIRYVAQIQVTSSGDQIRRGAGAVEDVQAFATETALMIRDLLPHDEVEAEATDAATNDIANDRQGDTF